MSPSLHSQIEARTTQLPGGRNHEAPHRRDRSHRRTDDLPGAPGVVADWLLSSNGKAGAAQDGVDGALEQPWVQIRLEERHLSHVQNRLRRR